MDISGETELSAYESKTIRYDEWISLPTNWDDHDYNDSIEYQKFIIDNLNDCPKY